MFTLCKLARSHSKQLHWIGSESSRYREFLFLPPTQLKTTFSLRCHHLNSSLSRLASHSPPTSARLTLMAPSAVLAYSTLNNTKTVTADGSQSGFFFFFFTTGGFLGHLPRHSRHTEVDCPISLSTLAIMIQRKGLNFTSSSSTIICVISTTLNN